MRKTFKFICAAVVAAFAVSSCYDDALVWDELDKHAGEIAGLEERVAALETKLNSEVAAINSLVATLDGKVKDLTAADADLLAKITALNTSVEGAVKDAKAAKEAAAAVTTLTSQLDALDGTVDGIIADLEAALEKMDAADGELDGKLTKLAGDLKGISTNLAAALAKIAVTNVEQKADGSVVLTLADDSKVTISAPVAGDETTTTGLVTIVTVDGVKYWAVVAEDGTATNLGIEVGHPDVNLSFMVDPETSELLVSYDGGENYEGTDVTIKDPEAYDHIVEDFTEDDEFVTFTIGGVEYSLVKYSVEHSALSLKAGKTYFDAGESFTVGINVAEVKEFYVMSKPDGWKAKVNGSKLTVTAPKAELIESGAAESDGLILLHGTTLKGDCKVAKLAVAVGSGLEVSIDKDGNITISNALVQEFESYVGGTYFDFANYMYGIAPLETFNEDPFAYVANIAENYDDFSNWSQAQDMYDETEYPVDVFTSNINTLYRSWFYEDLPKGEHYAVWVAPLDAMYNTIAEELSFVYYQPVELEMSTGETYYNDIELSVAAYGAESVQFGMLSEKDLKRYIENGAVEDFESYMKFSEGPWGRFEKYGAEIGEAYVINGEETLLLSELLGSALAPNMKYYIYALPIVAGKDMADYTYEDLVFHEATTSNVTSGGAAYFEFTEVVEDYYRIDVNYYAEDAEIIFYNYYTEETYNSMDAADVLADLVSNGTPTKQLEGLASWSNYVEVGYERYGVEPGKTFVVAAIAVDSEGCYNQLVVKTIAGKELVWATDFNVAVESAYFVGTVGYLTVSTGDVAATKYYYAKYESSRNMTVDDLKADPEYMLKAWNPWTTASKNTLMVQSMAEGVSYDIFITATNEDGEWAEIQKFTYTVPAVQKQWISPAEDGLSTNLVGAPARGVFDFGVNSKTKFTLGFSMEDLYPDVEQVVGQWMPMNVAGYQIVPTDAASGKINITQENVVGDMEVTGYILYSDLSETSCTFDLSHFIPVGTFTCTKAESKITFTEGGIAQ